MSIFDPVSAAPWEQISERIRPQVSAMVQSARESILHDQSIRYFLKGEGPVYWKNLEQILEQRCDLWLCVLYEFCCTEWLRLGKTKSAEFLSSIWTYELQIFIDKDLPDLLRLALSLRKPPREVRDNELTIEHVIANTTYRWQRRIEAEQQDVHNQTRESPVSESLLTEYPDKASKVSEQEEKEIARAMVVEKIRREIMEIAQAINLPEDYETRIKTNKEFASYLTVNVCNRHSDLREKLCAIKPTPKPRIIWLACEIAARSSANAGVKPSSWRTYEDAHKRYGAEARKRLGESR